MILPAVNTGSANESLHWWGPLEVRGGNVYQPSFDT